MVKCKKTKPEKHMMFTSRNWFAMQGPVAIILISWNVIFIWETGYWTRAIKRFALFDLLKSLYSDTNILSKYIPSLQKQLYHMTAPLCLWKCIKIKKSKKEFFCQYDVKVGLTTLPVNYVYGTALTTILPILFLYLNTVTVTAGTFEP